MTIKLGNEEYYTKQELMEMFNVRPTTVNYWQSSKGLKYLEVTGKRRLVSAKALQEFISRKKVKNDK